MMQGTNFEFTTEKERFRSMINSVGTEKFDILRDNVSKIFNKTYAILDVGVVQVAVGKTEDNTPKIIQSIGGYEWATRWSGNIDTTLTDIAYGNGKFVAVGMGHIITSDNGLVWTKEDTDLNPLQNLRCIEFLNNGFVAAGDDVIATSLDGDKWNIITYDKGYRFYSIRYVNGIYKFYNLEEAIYKIDMAMV